MNHPCTTCNRYKTPYITVDGVIQKDENILLVKRSNADEPFYNTYALPGGFVEYNEETAQAVVREIWEETGLKTEVNSLVGVYSKKNRDPRGHVVSVVYSLRMVGGLLTPSSETRELSWFPIDHLPALAFDHADIIYDFRSSNRAVTKYNGWNMDKKLIFCSQSRFYMFASELICKFVIDEGHVPINSFTNFGYFLSELVPRHDVVENINNIINNCHELWVFGPVTDGVDLEIAMCKAIGKPMRFFDISEEEQPCLITEVDEQFLREKKW